ncbi:UDP-N-acetylmuramate dehydrogenase [Dokdonella immobilis]|uniref:UDP-N-acetylenolpyruvoylglucosamine reductase n=1 Tax=Dokdonella immobilis TaxID=578942 RepID=A0A1I4XXU0_9GAMM|nr:UDP-N-acetylmuramate dehydrogenase [Dokdonella immobilis]SFN30718.1 UDP-N-acetylmuramate dehydrogenase [Dokdonella immobilis]
MSEKRYHVDAAIAEGVGYTIVENASLEGRNTFRVPARARMLIDVRRREALAELFGFAMLKSAPLLVLGEGSNILFTRDWPGIVLSIAALGIEVREDDGERALVRVEAGESWNDFVRWSLGRGFCGLENLVLIPGTVGAAPIQNIGAYGVEVSEFIDHVEAWDRAAGELVRLSNPECRFGYRDSVFKHQRDRYIVTAVTFALSRSRPLRVDYAGVAEELAVLGIETPTAPAVAEAIARIRTRKLPNPALIGNAGSFFKNPVVTRAEATALGEANPGMPAWDGVDNQVKLSAAWLIESCGFKGLQQGHAAVSEQHALVLVNRGRATGSEVWALAERIRGAVTHRFGVDLEAEPLVL